MMVGHYDGMRGFVFEIDCNIQKRAWFSDRISLPPLPAEPVRVDGSPALFLVPRDHDSFHAVAFCTDNDCSFCLYVDSYLKYHARGREI